MFLKRILSKVFKFSYLQKYNCTDDQKNIKNNKQTPHSNFHIVEKNLEMAIRLKIKIYFFILIKKFGLGSRLHNE